MGRVQRRDQLQQLRYPKRRNGYLLGPDNPDHIYRNSTFEPPQPIQAYPTRRLHPIEPPLAMDVRPQRSHILVEDQTTTRWSLWDADVVDFSNRPGQPLHSRQIYQFSAAARPLRFQNCYHCSAELTPGLYTQRSATRLASRSLSLELSTDELLEWRNTRYL